MISSSSSVSYEQVGMNHDSECRARKSLTRDEEDTAAAASGF